MKYNALNSIVLASMIATVFMLGGCPEPTREENEQLLIDRSQSQISDNKGIESEKLCLNHENKKHIYRSHHDFAERWYECAETKTWFPPTAILKTECVLEKFPSMTDKCVGCFGKMTSCSAEKCWKSCFNDSKGIECQNCAVKECSDEMFSCSGIPPIEIPDFKRD